MKYRVEAGLICFLLLVLISIGDPMVYVGGLLRRLPNLEPAEEMKCLAQTLPVDARALLFSLPDGTLDWNAHNFILTRLQYQLAPRVIIGIPSGPAAPEKYPYWLAYRLDAQSIAQMSGQTGRAVLQTCAGVTVLGPAR